MGSQKAHFNKILEMQVLWDDPCPFLCRLIYDPGTGKPRGFGFCEYEDTETAMSAVRNLAGRELNGRPLRIDSASNAPGGGGGGQGGPGGTNVDAFRGVGAGPGPKPVEVNVILCYTVPVHQV